MMKPAFLCGMPTLLAPPPLEPRPQGPDGDDDDTVAAPRLPRRRFCFSPGGGTNSAEAAAAAAAAGASASVAKATSRVQLDVRAYEQLPPDEAMALLDGLDHTGAMVWQGAARMAQWLVDLDHRVATASAEAGAARVPLLVAAAPRASTVHHCVHGLMELGAGAGLAGLAAAAMLRDFAPPSAATTHGPGTSPSGSAPDHVRPVPWVVLTDGNADCAELAAANLRDNAAVVAPGDDAARTAGATLHWGLTAASFPAEVRALLAGAARDERTAHEHHQQQAHHHFAIVAADVIYSLEAVTPIVRTVHTVAAALRDALIAASRATNRPWRKPGNENGDSSDATTSDMETFYVHFLIAFYPRAWYTETNTVLFQRLCDGLTEPAAYFAAQRQVLHQLAEDARVVEQLVGQPAPDATPAPTATSAYQTPVEVAAAALRAAKRLETDTSAAEVAAVAQWVPWRVVRQEVAEAPESSGVEPGREGSLLHFELCIATR